MGLTTTCSFHRFCEPELCRTFWFDCLFRLYQPDGSRLASVWRCGSSEHNLDRMGALQFSDSIQQSTIQSSLNQNRTISTNKVAPSHARSITGLKVMESFIIFVFRSLLLLLLATAFEHFALASRNCCFTFIFLRTSTVATIFCLC